MNGIDYVGRDESRPLGIYLRTGGTGCVRSSRIIAAMRLLCALRFDGQWGITKPGVDQKMPGMHCAILVPLAPPLVQLDGDRQGNCYTQNPQQAIHPRKLVFSNDDENHSDQNNGRNLV